MVFDTLKSALAQRSWRPSIWGRGGLWACVNPCSCVAGTRRARVCGEISIGDVDNYDEVLCDKTQFGSSPVESFIRKSRRTAHERKIHSH